MSWRAPKHSPQGHQVPKVLSTPKWPATTFIYSGSPQTSCYLKNPSNRVFADCSPQRNWTVHHSNPMARTAMIVCQTRPLEPWADCPHAMGRQSAVQNSERPETKMFLTKSESDLRTVCSLGEDRPPFNLGQHPPSRMVLFEFKSEIGGPSAPGGGPSTGRFPAKTTIGKMLITFSSELQFQRSWTFWKA